MKLTKTSIVPALAISSTAGLFYIMQGMVAAEEIKLIDEPDIRFIDVVYNPKPETPRVKERIKPPVPVEEPPETPEPLRPDDSDTPRPDYVPVPPPALQDELGPRFDPAAMDGEMVPLVRVNPIYPIGAIQRGIEGWVEVLFDVNAYGMVENPEVVAFEPSSVFNRATVTAISKFRYKPRVVDGQSYGVNGVRFRMVYTLDN